MTDAYNKVVLIGYESLKIALFSSKSTWGYDTFWKDIGSLVVENTPKPRHSKAGAPHLYGLQLINNLAI